MKTCIHLTKKNRYLITPYSCALFGFESPMKMSRLLSFRILRHFSARFIFHTCSALCTVFAPHLPMSFSILPKIFLTKIFCTLLSVQALKRLKLPVFSFFLTRDNACIWCMWNIFIWSVHSFFSLYPFRYYSLCACCIF